MRWHGGVAPRNPSEPPTLPHTPFSTPPPTPLPPLQGLQQMFVPPSPRPQSAADVFYAQLLAGLGGYPDPSPIFVVGMPRSGSTLIEQILSTHSQVWGAGGLGLCQVGSALGCALCCA